MSTHAMVRTSSPWVAFPWLQTNSMYHSNIQSCWCFHLWKTFRTGSLHGYEDGDKTWPFLYSSFSWETNSGE